MFYIWGPFLATRKNIIRGLRQSHKRIQDHLQDLLFPLFLWPLSPWGQSTFNLRILVPSGFVHLWLYQNLHSIKILTREFPLCSQHLCILAQAKALRSRKNSVRVQFQVFRIGSREIWWWCCYPKILFYHH